MSQTLLTVRMDADIKNSFNAVCTDLGLTMTTAVNLLARKMALEKRLPFEVSMTSREPVEAASDAEVAALSAKFMKKNRKAYEILAQ